MERDIDLERCLHCGTEFLRTEAVRAPELSHYDDSYFCSEECLLEQLRFDVDEVDDPAAQCRVCEEEFGTGTECCPHVTTIERAMVELTYWHWDEYTDRCEAERYASRLIERLHSAGLDIVWKGGGA